MGAPVSNRSLAQNVAALSPEDRAALLGSLTKAQAAELLHDWKFWARPNQLAPVRALDDERGDWMTWLALAGRGFGKTEAGAQWIRQRVAGGARMIALIAETQKDLEEVMVKRLVSIYPPDEAPAVRYKPVRLMWPNGAIAYGYNGTEPNQLRGPEFDTAWCFIAGTMVSTPTGDRPIESIQSGDLVLTRDGPRSVIASGSRIAPVGKVSFSDGRFLVGTAEHPVYLANGWTKMSDLEKGDRVCAIDASNGAAVSGIATAKDITSVRIRAFRRKRLSTFTERFIGRNTALFRWVMMSITRTKTRPIMTPTILKRLRVQIIESFTSQSIPSLGLIGVKSLSSKFYAQDAEQNYSEESAFKRSAKNVRIERLKKLEKSNEFVQSVKEFTYLDPETSALSVASIWQHQGEQSVFCLTVEESPEYFANGVLVHNCDELAKYRYARELWDMLMFTMRSGSDPRVFVTTTPRPIPVLREILKDPKTEVTRGSTFDNAGNVPQQFLDNLRKKYEGTRLGRQELNAEILDDTPGALWDRDMIEQANAKRTIPDMKRVVVAVDPSGTRGENEDDGDAIGIVVAGKGIDGRAYILADRTCKLSPNGWARRAVAAYREFEADRIVAETNYGGAMVELTVRTADPKIPYSEVKATRGKVIRAEPVAALYEQGRVTHVRPFDELEDEMCQMTAHDGFTGEGSPNRVDALVWALTELMLDEQPREIKFTPELIQRLAPKKPARGMVGIRRR